MAGNDLVIAEEKSDNFQRHKMPLPTDNAADYEKKDEIDVIDSCDDKTYYLVSFTYIFITIVISIFVDDLSFIFGMIAGLNLSVLVFILPGVFYIMAMKSENSDKYFTRVAVTLFSGMGVIYFFVSNYYNF